MSARLDDLFHTLSREVAQFKQLNQLLNDELTALREKDTPRIQQLSEQKTQHLNQLQHTMTQHQQWLTEHQVEPSKDATQAFLQALPDGKQRQVLLQLWQALCNESDACQRQNAVNGQIIHSNRRQTEHLLNLLQGRSTSSYDASGETVQQHSEQTLVTKA